jgi:hypothetical protein
MSLTFCLPAILFQTQLSSTLFKYISTGSNCARWPIILFASTVKSKAIEIAAVSVARAIKILMERRQSKFAVDMNLSTYQTDAGLMAHSLSTHPSDRRHSTQCPYCREYTPLPRRAAAPLLSLVPFAARGMVPTVIIEESLGLHCPRPTRLAQFSTILDSSREGERTIAPWSYQTRAALFREEPKNEEDIEEAQDILQAASAELHNGNDLADRVGVPEAEHDMAVCQPNHVLVDVKEGQRKPQPNNSSPEGLLSEAGSTLENTDSVSEDPASTWEGE